MCKRGDCDGENYEILNTSHKKQIKQRQLRQLELINEETKTMQ